MSLSKVKAFVSLIHYYICLSSYLLLTKNLIV